MNRNQRLVILLVFVAFFARIICACASTDGLSKEESNQKERLPSYYDSYLYTIAHRIKNVVSNSSRESDGFFFITDTHVADNALNSGNILCRLQELTQVKKVFWGGDAVCAFGTKADLDEQISIQDNYLKNCNDKGMLLKVRGNHDYLIMNNKNDMSNGYLYSETFTNQHMLMDKKIKAVFDDNNQDTYYYVDNKEANIRYIILSTTESLGEGTVISGNVRNGLKWNEGTQRMKRQWDWLFTKALNTNMNVVIISHIPISYICSRSGNDNYELRQALRAFKKRLQYGEYDFSNANANLVACIAGHSHVDSQEMNDGVLFVTTSCDAFPDDDGSTKNVAIDVITDKRGKGTIKEQLIDYYNIDIKNNIVSTLRIGGGKDRYFHINTIELEIGDTCTLIPQYIETNSWKSYNEGNHDNTDDVWPKWINGERNLVLPNDRVSVQNGVVTAKKSGGANVVAISNDNVIELFYIKVN